MAPKRKAAEPAVKAEAPAKRGRRAAAKKEVKEEVKDEPETKVEAPVPAKEESASEKDLVEVILERWSKANKAVEALKAAGFDAKVSSAKPRRGAFNFVVKTPKGDVEVWDGFAKGPPRAEKFPDHDELVKLVKGAL